MVETVDQTINLKNGLTNEDLRPTHPSRARLHYAALLETSQALNRILDFHEILQFILDKMLEVAGADSAKAFIFYEDNLQFIGGREPHRASFEDNSTTSEKVIECVRQTRELVCVREVARDPHLRNDVILATRYISAVLALPMFRGDELFGLVYMDSHAAMPFITDLELGILQGMAAQIALVTENAVNLSEIARMNESLDGEVQVRTEQLMEANHWLASRLEKAERTVAEQNETDKKRSRYYSALSHELRSPMQLLLGHGHMMTQEGAANLSESQAKSLNVIMKTSEHVRDLVSKVIDANKFEEGGMSIAPVAFDLRPLIEEVAEMGRGLLGEKPVQIIRYYNAEEFPLVAADPLRIRQVLLNLMANACRFTDKGKITISATAHDAYVVVSVVDTGVGIPADKVATIFEPYRQADSLRAHSGAGLGLAISKQLVELHGGRMVVKSTEGSGTIIAFNLPIAL